MTVPLAPSATTTPVRDRTYWTAVIHNAAKVSPDDPRYPASRQVAQIAIQGLQDLASTAGEKDIKDISPGKLGTAAVSFGHGASLGLAGDPTYLNLAQQANPKTAFLSDVAGTAALAKIASPAVAGLRPVVQGAVLGGGLLGARGAIEPPFPQMTRAENATIMGAGGAISGGLLTKFVAGAGPVIRTIVNNLKGLAGYGAPADIAAITESAIRAQLAKLKVAPELIERAVQSWKTTGQLTVQGMTAPPAEPITVRPGETITQTAPKGFEVTGARATPPAPTTPTVAEMMGGPPATPAGATPYDQASAARAAYHLAGAAGQDATAAASRAAGTYSSFDPRQALLLALLLGQRPSQ